MTPNRTPETLKALLRDLHDLDRCPPDEQEALTAHADAWEAESMAHVGHMEGAYEKGRQAGRDEYRRSCSPPFRPGDVIEAFTTTGAHRFIVHHVENSTTLNIRPHTWPWRLWAWVMRHWSTQ